MLEMLERMASDRLWIYTGIVGSLFGAVLSCIFSKIQSRTLVLCKV